jgi:hypothetical protein
LVAGLLTCREADAADAEVRSAGSRVRRCKRFPPQQLNLGWLIRIGEPVDGVQGAAHLLVEAVLVNSRFAVSEDVGYRTERAGRVGVLDRSAALVRTVRLANTGFRREPDLSEQAMLQLARSAQGSRASLS